MILQLFGWPFPQGKSMGPVGRYHNIITRIRCVVEAINANKLGEWIRDNSVMPGHSHLHLAAVEAVATIPLGKDGYFEIEMQQQVGRRELEEMEVDSCIMRRLALPHEVAAGVVFWPAMMLPS